MKIKIFDLNSVTESAVSQLISEVYVKDIKLTESKIVIIYFDYRNKK